jgi:cytochrome P450
MGWFLDECLRVWTPTVGVLNRLTTEEMQIGPYKLPKDFNVGTNILGLKYNTKFYDEP